MKFLWWFLLQHPRINKLDLFGKCFVVGVAKFRCNIFNRTTLSSHDDEDRCADNDMFDKLARSATVSKHYSLLFDYDDEDVFRSNSSIDYERIADNVKIKWIAMLKNAQTHAIMDNVKI